MNRQHFKAAAEAFAGITDIESACYHYTHDGFKQIHKEMLINYYTVSLKHQINAKYINAVVVTAIIELQYPVISDNYAWSSNQRADFAGIPRATWSRNKLSDDVNFIINDIHSKSIIVWHARQQTLLT